MRALEWVEDADDEDERRRTHRITRAGRDVLRAEVRRLEELLSHARPAVAGNP
jgi:hypothetical protein